MRGDMELRRGVLSLCLLSILAGVTAEPECVVFVPGLLKSGENGTVCMIAKGHTEPMDVDVNIGEPKISIFKLQVPPGDYYKCNEFQVPEQTKAAPAFLNIEARSGSFNYTRRQAVLVTPTSDIVLIRPDKYLYKAGQTANFLIMALNNRLQPVETMLPLIYLLDTNGNRMTEWRDQNTTGGFCLISYTFLKDPDFGLYQCVVQTQSGKTFAQTVKVDDYVLPKFEITVNTPKAATIEDTKLPCEVKAQYTYGQPVPGKVTMRLCRPPSYYYVGDPCNRNPDGICDQITKELDSEGKCIVSMDLARYQFNRPGYNMLMVMEVTVTEQGTGVQMTETKNIPITNTMARASFVDKHMVPYYKRNMPYHVEIKVEDALGQPKVNQSVELQVNGKKVHDMISDKDGKAQCEVDTSEFGTSEIQLQLIYTNEPQCYDSNWVVPTYQNDYRTIRRFFSGNGCFLQLRRPRKDLQCGETHNIEVSYLFSKDALEANANKATFFVMVISRAKIVYSKKHVIDQLPESRQGKFYVSYTALPEHVPSARVVAVTLVKGEIVADTVEFPLDKCFKNNVSVSFSSEKGTPGSTVNAQVKAMAASVCVGRMSDYSLLLMDQGDTLTPDKVYSSLQHYILQGFYYEGYDVSPPQPPCVNANEQIMYNNTYYSPSVFPNEEDASKLFASYGLMVLTTALFQQRPLCSQPYSFQPRPPIFARPSAFGGAMAFADEASFAMTSTAAVPDDFSSGVPGTVSERSFFPENLLFYPLITDASGSVVHPIPVPGTITTWNYDAICLSSDEGFGMSRNPANFTSFLKVFADVSHADSIMRGEILTVIVAAANYMENCAMMHVSLAPSPGYTAEPVDASPRKCVCSGQREAFTWKINATSLGKHNITVTAKTESIYIGEKCEGPTDPKEQPHTDIITQTFYVDPEGVKKDATQTNFVCVKGGSSEVEIDMNPTVSIVPGSLIGTFQLIGNILGPALVSSEAMFNVPMGCGQQNLAKLVPIISVMEYLEKTDSLTNEIKEIATTNMRIGYIKQLQYWNSDGSFSPFKGGEASSWLTLDSLIALSRCKRYITVEERIFLQGAVYISSLQDLNTGSLKPKGMNFNHDLRDSDEEVSFTAKVVCFLVDFPNSLSPGIYERAKYFLESASQKEQSPFNQVMIEQALKKAESLLATPASEKVKAMAIEEGGMVHLEPLSKPKPEASTFFSPPSSSDAIELTAIALTTFLHGENPSEISQENLAYATKMALWLAKEQKKGGAYGTTLDTITTIDALATYAEFVHQKDASITVQLKKGDNIVREFTVDSSNSHLLQTEPLHTLPGKYKAVVSGSGCALLQGVVQYHLPFKQENAAFALTVTTFPKDCQDGVAPRFTVQVNASYIGNRNRTNMVLIRVPCLSGYTVEHKSLSQLRTQFPKVEVEKNELIIYLNEMVKGVTLFFNMERSKLVSIFQYKTAAVNDYYMPEENGRNIIKHPCTLQPESQQYLAQTTQKERENRKPDKVKKVKKKKI